MKASPSQIPEVSASKYAEQAATSAKVRMRIKGMEDGPIYQGQHVVRQCPTCPPYPFPGQPTATTRHPTGQAPAGT